MGLIMPVSSHARSISSPIHVDISFESRQPILNSPENLSLRITSFMDVSDAAIDVLLPEEIRLIGGDESWFGDIGKDEIIETSIVVEIVKTGRFTIKVDVDCEQDSTYIASICHTQYHLNIIASDREVIASTDSFRTMILKRARTPEEREKLRREFGLRGGIRVPTPPSSIPIVPKPLPDFLKPEQDSSIKPDEEFLKDSSAETEAVVTVTVSGTMTYKDFTGRTHPIRYAKVRVLDKDTLFDDIMGEGSTGPDGKYSIEAIGGDPDSPPDIEVRVYTAIANNKIATVKSPAGNIYYIAEFYENYADTMLDVSLTTDTPISGSTDDSDEARAFSILDAVLQFAVEAYCLNGSLLPRIRVNINDADDGSYYQEWPVIDDELYIARSDAFDWDVIGHEYGHYLVDEGTSIFNSFFGAPGGIHSGGSTIPLYGKRKGIKLAYSEALSTFFSIAVQVESECTGNFGIFLPDIPNTGNRIWEDKEISGLSLDLEDIGNGNILGPGQGYASENSISASLYDLIDSNSDTSYDGSAGDSIDVSPKSVWNVVNTSGQNNVGKLWKKIAGLVGVNARLGVAEIFAMNNIAPELQEPVEGKAVSGATSPTFSWLPNGDPNDGFELNGFTIYVSMDNFATILMKKSGITANEYTFSDEDWKTIVQAGDEDTKFMWAVTGYNDKSPRIPPTGGFLSNTQSFTASLYWTIVIDARTYAPEGYTYDNVDVTLTDCGTVLGQKYTTTVSNNCPGGGEGSLKVYLLASNQYLGGGYSNNGCNGRIAATSLGEFTKKDIFSKIYSQTTTIDGYMREFYEGIWELICELNDGTIAYPIDGYQKITEGSLSSLSFTEVSVNSPEITTIIDTLFPGKTIDHAFKSSNFSGVGYFINEGSYTYAGTTELSNYCGIISQDEATICYKDENCDPRDGFCLNARGILPGHYTWLIKKVRIYIHDLGYDETYGYPW